MSCRKTAIGFKLIILQIEIKMMENKEIVITKQEVNNFTNFSSMDEMLTFSASIAKSGLSPLKKAEDVMSAILMGKELGLGTMTAISNIYPINGKASLGVHVINALLLKAGITYKITEDYAPVIGVKDKGLPTETKAVIDYRTTILFNRLVKRENGSFKEMEVSISYSLSEARAAGLLAKDNWKNHPKTMTRNRALAIGGRMIAGDILLGCYETSELLDSNNVKHNVSEDGTVTILQSNIKNEQKSNDVVEVHATEITSEQSEQKTIN